MHDKKSDIAGMCFLQVLKSCSNTFILEWLVLAPGSGLSCQVVLSFEAL